MNKFAHMELNTSDTEAAKDFYERLFGWSYDGLPMPNGETYWFVKAEGMPSMAINRKAMSEAPTSWLGYVSVDSVRASIDRARGLGAQVVLDYMPVGDMGAMAVLLDPTGAPVALWEDSDKARSDRAARDQSGVQGKAQELRDAVTNAVSEATRELKAKLDAAEKALSSAMKSPAKSAINALKRATKRAGATAKKAAKKAVKKAAKKVAKTAPKKASKKAKKAPKKKAKRR
jgi:uncharacterized protein